MRLSNREYLEGYRSYFLGELRSNNPYLKNNNKYREWDDGWCDANVEDDEQRKNIENEGS